MRHMLEMSNKREMQKGRVPFDGNAAFLLGMRQGLLMKR